MALYKRMEISYKRKGNNEVGRSIRYHIVTIHYFQLLKKLNWNQINDNEINFLIPSN